MQERQDIMNNLLNQPKTWYLDQDGDRYHSQVRQSAKRPGAKWTLFARGKDCNDTNKHIYKDCSTHTVYRDEDKDNYYKEKKERVYKAQNGAYSSFFEVIGNTKTVLQGRWNTTSNKGQDCDDTDATKKTDCSEKPCVSADGKKGDPLINIQVLGTKNNGISGGLYGNGRGRFHDGTDFVTPVGTPIYSMFDGVVDFSITSHFEGEKWENKDSWNGDKNAAGNRIYISSTVGSDKLQFGYWHLSEVNINPNTGKFYKSGDEVKQGAIIGFAGSTGNANSADSAGSHLHLRGRKNGQKYDPLNSLQSTIDPVTGKGSCE